MPKKTKTKYIKPIEDEGVKTKLQFDIMKDVEKNKKIKEKDVFNNYEKPKRRIIRNNSTSTSSTLRITFWFCFNF